MRQSLDQAHEAEGRTVTAPYQALAEVYDRWNAPHDHGRWAEFITSRLPDAKLHDVHLIDVCCGTGAITRLLVGCGYMVTGVDQSEAMLAIARAAAPSARLIRATLPDDSFGDQAWFDAAICTFDSLNYLVTDGAAGKTLSKVAKAIRPGGIFIFDINTRYKLETVLGNRRFGDDLGDFAYIWRNHLDKDASTVDFLITLFVRRGNVFCRETEHHVQRWFDRDEIQGYIEAAGFTVESVTDDYTETPTTERTMRETWVLRRTD
jgi:SAM-dependent methyltransferase